MGRAIVLLFFVIGFFIFLTIKFAATGVKAAYKAVNDPVGFEAELNAARENPEMELVKVIVGSLSVQVAMMGEQSPGDVPSEGKDDWSLGYVLGYSQFFAGKANRISNGKQVIPPIVFHVLFGESVGAAAYDKVLRHVLLEEPQTRDGFKTGRREAMEWIGSMDDEASMVPTGWCCHVHEMRSETTDLVAKTT